ncbi:outer membrane receptor protein [Caulobacter sp. AP07]|uniref:TonB-dependent receptor n=1 Tax=Caulobacter sp. AP07 TaxID=1144304 RepID=UPI000271E34B|nr:TonB-dependent receptor [Caulobacter sp. AP07]EJL37696.1 outer membrane receptor protein [Caulobacter sp. AP07]
MSIQPRSPRALRAELLLGAAVGTAALLTAPVALAQTAPAANQVVSIDEIVVTAQKRAENVQDVPLAITAARGETLAAMNITQPQQLSLIDPSVRFKQSLSSSASGLTIRGIGTSSFSAGIEQSISTVVDGVVLADPASLATLADIERVEILRGPQGMLFGKNASAGLVHFITNRPRLGEDSGLLHVQFGERGEQILQAVGNVALGETFALRLVATHNERDGLIRNLAQNNVDTDPQDISTLALKALWRPNDDLSVYVSADRTDNDAFCCSSTWRKVTPGYAPAVTNARYGIVAGPKNLQVATNGPFQGKSTAQGASLQVDYGFNDLTLTSISAYRSVKRSGFYDGDLTPVSYVDVNGGAGKTDWFSQELRLTSPIGERFDYVAGLYLYHSKASSLIRQRGQLSWIVPASNGAVIPVVPGAPLGTIFETSTYNDINSTSLAGFGQVGLHITPKLDLIAGARVTRDEITLDYRRAQTPGAVFIPGSVAVTLHQAIDNTNVSWRIGPRYNFSDDIMGYVTVSRGYKGPGFSGLSAANTLADQRVRPEIPTSYELGLKTALLDRRLTVDAAVYSTTVKNFQAQVSDLSSATYSSRITNAGEIKTRGVEVSLVARPTRGLTMTAGGAYTHARYVDFNGVQCYFGQPKIAQGGPCSAPPANPASLDGFFNAAGRQLAGTADWVYGASLAYERPVTPGLRGFFQANWNWQSDINYSASGDPGTIQKAYGLLGGRLGVSAPDKAWSLALYASNLLDKRYAAQITPSPVTALNPGGYIQYFSPDSVRRVGVSLDVSF